MIEEVEPFCRRTNLYLMGWNTANILRGSGVDMFDCVMPARAGVADALQKAYNIK